MAEVIYQDPVQEIRGTLTKDGTIHRRKYYRDANGKIIGASKPEAYQILYPRNWKKNPAKDKELEHQLRFKAACAETKRILMAAKYLKAQATQSTNPALPSDYRHRPPQDLFPLRCLHPHLPFARDAMTFAYFCRNHIQSAEKFAYLKKK